MITSFSHEDLKKPQFAEEMKGFAEVINALSIRAADSRKKCRFLKSTTEVGCAILTDQGDIVWGCNFDYEWGIAIHAEDTAICNMISACPPTAKIRAVYLYIEDRKNFTSCGSCRDKIRRFAEDPKRCLIYLDDGKEIRVFSLGELLPEYPER